ncbi:MAG: Gx transporter family protein [Pseudomonadota bacterium]
MKQREIRLEVTAQDHFIAALAALAVGLTVAESALPTPLPGVKPGLANIVVLLVMLRHGFAAAAWVMSIRVLAASLMLGTFLSPGFWLAVAGAAASMGVLLFSRFAPRRLFGPVSFSISMAFAHISGQLLLAKFWLFSSADIGMLLPPFALAALVFGMTNGLIVAGLIAQGAAPGAQSTHA